MKLIMILAIFFASTSYGFVLLNPKFELNDPTKTKIKVSSEGCTANGISDDEVAEAIKWAIDFWNDVPESRLKLSYGGKSTASVNDSSLPKNEIIVGCESLPSLQILGSTNSDYTNGSARIKMNNAVYTGNYNSKSFIGTLTHEIGHGLGLFHSNDPASVMTYVSHEWVDRPSYISQDDIDGIVYLYPNESSLGGLGGSCSSFASDDVPASNFYVDFLIGLFTIMCISFLMQKGLRKLFK